MAAVVVEQFDLSYHKETGFVFSINDGDLAFLADDIQAVTGRNGGIVVSAKLVESGVSRVATVDLTCNPGICAIITGYKNYAEK